MPETKKATQHYEVMTDTWGWGDPQLVRGDVVTAGDVGDYDLDWAVNMGTVRKMRNSEVVALESRGPGARGAGGLLSTVRPVGTDEEDAEDIQDAARADSGTADDEIVGLSGEPKAPSTGGGTAVNQATVEGNDASPTPAATPAPAKDAKADEKK